MCVSLTHSRALVLGILLIGAGCDGGPGVSLGEPQLRVTEGADQVHEAATQDSLDLPVVTQLYQTADGRITSRTLSPEEFFVTAEGVVKLFLPTPLHAQTNVVGVAGEQVCAVPIGNVPLEPWNPCDITAESGIAMFFFEPGTKAGEACAEVRAVIDGQKTITDTVCATVTPGPVAASGFSSHLNLDHDSQVVGLGASLFKDEHGNAVPYRVEADAPFVATVTPHSVELDIDPSTPIGASGEIRFYRLDDGSAIAAYTAVVQGSKTANSWDFIIVQ